MFVCKTDGIYSISFQKGTDQRYLDLVRIKAGKILNEDSITADYGMGISFWQVLMPLQEYFLRSFLYFVALGMAAEYEHCNNTSKTEKMSNHVRPLYHNCR
jgi:hypothetical protein